MKKCSPAPSARDRPDVMAVAIKAQPLPNDLLRTYAIKRVLKALRTQTSEELAISRDKSQVLLREEH